MTAARAKVFIAWALAVVLAFFMGGGGAAKLGGDAAMIEMFEHIGAGQWLRYAVGALEVAGGLGVLVPRVRSLAALGLVLLLVCATAINLAVLDASPVASVGLAAVALAVLLLRRDELTALVTRRSPKIAATPPGGGLYLLVSR